PALKIIHCFYRAGLTLQIPAQQRAEQAVIPPGLSGKTEAQQRPEQIRGVQQTLQYRRNVGVIIRTDTGVDNGAIGWPGVRHDVLETFPGQCSGASMPPEALYISAPSYYMLKSRKAINDLSFGQ